MRKTSIGQIRKDLDELAVRHSQLTRKVNALSLLLAATAVGLSISLFL